MSTGRWGRRTARRRAAPPCPARARPVGPAAAGPDESPRARGHRPHAHGNAAGTGPVPAALSRSSRRGPMVHC